MPEKTSLPVTVTRGPAEITVEIDPGELLGFIQDDEQVNRVELTVDGEKVAILQKVLGGPPLHGTPPSLDLTQEEASGFIEAIQEMLGYPPEDAN